MNTTTTDNEIKGADTPSRISQSSTHLFIIGGEGEDSGALGRHRLVTDTATYTAAGNARVSPRYIPGVLPAAPGLVSNLAQSMGPRV